MKQVRDFSYEDFIFKGFFPGTYDQDMGQLLDEIKSARTFSPDFITTFRFLDKNEDAGKDNKSIIYGGDDTFNYKGFRIVSWRDVRKFET